MCIPCTRRWEIGVLEREAHGLGGVREHGEGCGHLPHSGSSAGESARPCSGHTSREAHCVWNMQSVEQGYRLGHSYAKTVTCHLCGFIISQVWKRYSRTRLPDLESWPCPYNLCDSEPLTEPLCALSPL